MKEDLAVANALGTLGTVFWCIQLIPQIWFNYRRKNVEGLPPLMMFLWALSGLPFGVYFIVQKANIPVQIQPQLFTFFACLTWIQCVYYPPNPRPRKIALLYFAIFVAFWAAFEAGFIVGFKILYDRGVKYPNLIMGIVASVLLALGLIPPYFELAKRQGRVMGINFLFLLMDSLGALFSILSLLYQGGTIDTMGIILYSIVLALELGIFTSQLVWIIRFRKWKMLKVWDYFMPRKFGRKYGMDDEDDEMSGQDCQNSSHSIDQKSGSVKSDEKTTVMTRMVDNNSEQGSRQNMNGDVDHMESLRPTEDKGVITK